MTVIDARQLNVIWHDLECGGYTQDLALWREVSAARGGPILDVGAGTGRVTLELARDRHDVTALDLDEGLLAELRRRAGERPVLTAAADAREFALDRRFALCLVPMQTIQLLGGPAQRIAFLRCARAHLAPGGMLAAAIVEELQTFEDIDGMSTPLPDMVERDGVVYSSLPTAIRADADAGGFLLERRREMIGRSGERIVEDNVVRLDALSASQLEAEALDAGLRPCGHRVVRETDSHVGSLVVMLRA